MLYLELSKYTSLTKKQHTMTELKESQTTVKGFVLLNPGFSKDSVRCTECQQSHFLRKNTQNFIMCQIIKHLGSGVNKN